MIIISDACYVYPS